MMERKLLVPLFLIHPLTKIVFISLYYSFLFLFLFFFFLLDFSSLQLFLSCGQEVTIYAKPVNFSFFSLYLILSPPPFLLFLLISTLSFSFPHTVNSLLLFLFFEFIIIIIIIMIGWIWFIRGTCPIDPLIF